MNKVRSPGCSSTKFDLHWAVLFRGYVAYVYPVLSVCYRHILANGSTHSILLIIILFECLIDIPLQYHSPNSERILTGTFLERV